MKNLLFLTIATALIVNLTSARAEAATAQSFQNGPTEISYTIIQLASIDANIASIRMNDSGVITVTKHDRSMKRLKLSDENKQDMFWLAQLLVEAELETETRTSVCEILLPAFSIQNLRIYDSATQQMKLVLSSGSCALPNYTHPIEAHLTESAKELKAKLVVLAQQMIVAE